MRTYPNQKVIHIQKKKYEDNFLQVGNDEWQEAARVLSGSAFKLYLYMAGNKDGFDMALSQKAVEDAIGLSKNTYHRAVEELQEKGYMTRKQGNIYAFTPTALPLSTQNGYIPKIGSDTTQNGESIYPKLGVNVPKMGREIDKIDNIDNIDNGADVISPEEEKELETKHNGDRRIRDLSDAEAREIKEKLKAGVRYLDIEKQYGMKRGTITAQFSEHWRQFIVAKANGRI